MNQREPPILTRVRRLDSIRLDSTYFTGEGYLVDEPIVTGVGIFEYKNPDGSIRRELRLPDEVFAEKSLASYEGKPVIITHEAGRVDKTNVDREIVGTILSKGYRDGDDVRAKIIIHDFDTVKRSGLRELSLGYDLTLDETPGEWNGQPYDAIQTEIMINHLALVTNQMNMLGDLRIYHLQTVGILRYGHAWARIAPEAEPAYGEPIRLINSGDYAGMFTNDPAEGIAIYGRFIGPAGTGPGGIGDNTTVPINIAPVEIFNQMNAAPTA